MNRAPGKSYKPCISYTFICINQKHSINIIIDFLLEKLKMVAQLIPFFSRLLPPLRPFRYNNLFYFFGTTQAFLFSGFWFYSCAVNDKQTSRQTDRQPVECSTMKLMTRHYVNIAVRDHGCK